MVAPKGSKARACHAASRLPLEQPTSQSQGIGTRTSGATRCGCGRARAQEGGQVDRRQPIWWCIFSSATSPPPLPTLPPETRPLELYIAGSIPTFSRSQLLLTVRGHRILFLDTPGRAFSNKWIEWECRLLYPNYPVDSIHTITKWWWHRPEKAAQQVTPVEGVHYKLVMSHSDRNQSTFRLCAWRGANGHGNGQASVDVELLESLVDAVAPVWAQAADEMTLPSTSAGATDEATVEEVVFIVLAFIPVMTMAITTRRQLVQLWPLVLCLLLAPILKIFQLI
ncbi:hypothetical protein BCR44DRAFT_1084999 [Catenaria anguillulae PL171]|uniref:Uncharacterized protein n=1 Tax=Catenaria anguillulae PL171 TaxID=765915 RepID=A0A1Y2HQK4_9FUNG|nr:hypothetical protein BCR44DRAFT_1084999 [Catenaria anguillulae PL171]